MSKPAKLLKGLLLEQVEGKILFSTSANVQFQHEFCTDGLVLGPLGQILFFGSLADAIQWANQNLEGSDILESEEDSFEINLNLSNSDTTDDGMDF